MKIVSQGKQGGSDEGETMIPMTLSEGFRPEVHSRHETHKPDAREVFLVI